MKRNSSNFGQDYSMIFGNSQNTNANENNQLKHTDSLLRHTDSLLGNNFTRNFSNNFSTVNSFINTKDVYNNDYVNHKYQASQFFIFLIIFALFELYLDNF